MAIFIQQFKDSFITKEGAQYYLVVNGKAGKAYDTIGELIRDHEKPATEVEEAPEAVKETPAKKSKPAKRRK